MLYLDEEDLILVFETIAKHYAKEEEIPDYSNENEGYQSLVGVLERVKMEHYLTLEDKVVYLFIQINKGHFFSNGNKRLSLVVALAFLIFNDKAINLDMGREQFKEILVELFPGSETELKDFEEFSPSEYALYNLSIIVADSHKYVTEKEGFDVLKQKVTKFFARTVVDE